MPFAYAGTRRRRNRDRRRAHDTMAADSGKPEAAKAGEGPLSERRVMPTPDGEHDTVRRARQGEMPPGVDGDDLSDPGNRDPDAPPVDNRS